MQDKGPVTWFNFLYRGPARINTVQFGDNMEMKKLNNVAVAVAALVIQTTVSCSIVWTNGIMAPSDR